MRAGMKKGEKAMCTNKPYRNDDVLEIVEVTIYQPNRFQRIMYGIVSGLYWVQSHGALETDEYVHKFGKFVYKHEVVPRMCSDGVIRRLSEPVTLDCQRGSDGRWVANADNAYLKLI